MSKRQNPEEADETFDALFKDKIFSTRDLIEFYGIDALLDEEERDEPSA